MQVLRQIQNYICGDDERVQAEVDMLFESIERIIKRIYEEANRIIHPGQVCYRPSPNPKPLPAADIISCTVHEEIKSWLMMPIQPLEHREAGVCGNEQCYLQQDTQRYMDSRARMKDLEASKVLQKIADNIFEDVLSDVVDVVFEVDRQ